MRRPFCSAGMPRPRRCTDVVKGTRSRKRPRRFQSRARDVPPRPYSCSALDAISADGASRESSVRSHVQSICRRFADPHRLRHLPRPVPHLILCPRTRKIPTTSSDPRTHRPGTRLCYTCSLTPASCIMVPCTGVRSWRVFASPRIVGRGVSFRQVSWRKKTSLGNARWCRVDRDGRSSFSRNADKNHFWLSADPVIYGLRFGGLRSELL
jgi:hypothetical protein